MKVLLRVGSDNEFDDDTPDWLFLNITPQRARAMLSHRERLAALQKEEGMGDLSGLQFEAFYTSWLNEKWDQDNESGLLVMEDSDKEYKFEMWMGRHNIGDEGCLLVDDDFTWSEEGGDVYMEIPELTVTPHSFMWTAYTDQGETHCFAEGPPLELLKEITRAEAPEEVASC